MVDRLAPLIGGPLIGGPRIGLSGRGVRLGQLLVGQPLLVQRCPFLVKLRLGALPARLLLGDAGSSFGRLRTVSAYRCLLVVLGHGAPAPSLELELLRSDPSAAVDPRHGDGEHDNDQDARLRRSR